MIGIFSSDYTFHPGEYKCNSCGHETIIFIKSIYSLFSCTVNNKKCCNCGQIKETLADGDLIMRYDCPDGEDDPWQLQASFILDQDRYCSDCKNEIEEDWRKMAVTCSQCDGYMKFMIL